MLPEDDNEPLPVPTDVMKENDIEHVDSYPRTDKSSEECVASTSTESEIFTRYRVNISDFLIVTLKTNKRDRRFIGQVMNVKGNDLKVKCLRKNVGKKSVFFHFQTWMTFLSLLKAKSRAE